MIIRSNVKFSIFLLSFFLWIVQGQQPGASGPGPAGGGGDAGPPPQPPTIPLTSNCQGSQHSLLVMQMHKKSGGSGQTQSGVSLQMCANLCTGQAGSQANCAGFDFNAGSRTCTIYSNFDAASLQNDPSTDFYQKVCVESSNICSSPMQFEVMPQKILVGFARQVVTAPTAAECMKQCLDAYTTFGFECQSAMYYPGDQSCILNTETRLKRPDLFTDEPKEPVLYFDNNCAGGTCASSFVVQYTKTVDAKPSNLEGIQVPSSSLLSCQALCTGNIGKPGGESKNCKSFGFSSTDNLCVLYDDRIAPLGRSNATTTPGSDYYEKGCYKAQETCRNVPAFVRVPQMVLVGFAAYVIDGVPSVSQCLDACLKPPAKVLADNAQFKCMSVMYYYNQQECILNTETRKTKPDLFVSEVLKEDYFDIMCLEGPETCPQGSTLSSVRVKDSKLNPTNQTNVLKQASGTPADCLKQCSELSPQKCRSFNYNSGSSQCDLLMVNGDTEPVNNPSPGNDFYELICLPTDMAGCNAVSSFDLSPGKINRVGDTGGSGPVKSKKMHKKVKKRQADASGGASKVLGDSSTISLPDCLVACLKQACQGVNYNIQNGRCELYSSSGVLQDDTNSDFYTNACGAGGAPIETICNFDGMKVIENKPQPDRPRPRPYGGDQTPPPRPPYWARYRRQSPVAPPPYGQGPAAYGAATQPPSSGYGPPGPKPPEPRPPSKVFQPPTLPSKECGVVDFKNGTFKATIVVQANNLGIPGLVTSMDNIYDVSCDYSQFLAKKVDAMSGMHVEGPTPALIQPRGKVDLSSPVTMQLTGSNGAPMLHTTLGDILELRFEMMALDSKMDFFIKECVAERGGPMPPGLSCDGPDCGRRSEPTAQPGYGNAVPSTPGSSYGGTPAPPPGYPSRLKRQPSGYGGGPQPPPQREARCPPSGCSLIGGTKTTPNPNQLKLIEKGCPTPAVAGKIINGPVKKVSDKVKTIEMQAFRFDGSRTVRIICQLDICRKQCNPTTCSIGGSNQQSWGKKKRAAEPIIFSGFNHFKPHLEDDNETSHYETERYRVPKYSTAISSFVILDPDEEPPLPSNSLAQQSVQDIIEPDPMEIRVRSMPNNNGKVCLPKVTFMSVFLFLTVLTIAQGIGVAICLSMRLRKKKKI